MPFKFEKLEVWDQALDYIDLVYEIGAVLPKNEDYNLKSQMTRAATSIALNIAEGSTGQTDVEQGRFLGLAIRSLLETVACQHIIRRRKLVDDSVVLRKAYGHADMLAARLHAMRRTVAPDQGWLREETLVYEANHHGQDR